MRGEVLIVEDAEPASPLAGLLRAEGFTPFSVSTTNEAVGALESREPVAVLLDWMTLAAHGVDTCRDLRRLNETITIIFVTAHNDEASIIRAFDAGADDYVVKPFRKAELMVRLESNLRKVAYLQQPATPSSEVSTSDSDQAACGEVVVDYAARAVRVAGKPVALSALEFRLLEFMTRNRGRAFSRAQLLAGVYGYSGDISTDRIDVLVRRVRKRLGEGPLRGGQLVTVPGYGYRLDRRAAAQPD
jgi:DNA-binding response OmpR family regulator